MKRPESSSRKVWSSVSVTGRYASKRSLNETLNPYQVSQKSLWITASVKGPEGKLQQSTKAHEILSLKIMGKKTANIRPDKHLLEFALKMLNKKEK